MSQTSAPRREMLEGRLGLISQPFAPEDVQSCVSSAKSYYGRLAIQDGTVEGKCLHPSAAITSLPKSVLGVVASTHAIESEDGSEDPHYGVTKTINVLRKGYIWVAITEDVEIGDDVHVLFGAGNEGKFATTGGTDLTGVARWTRGGLAADGFAELEVNFI